MRNETGNNEVLQELIAIITSKAADQEIREKLDDYHENDIAEALENLEEPERKRLYRILGVEKVSEIFTYLDDVGMYLEELDVQKAADIIENMDADDAVDALEEVDSSIREQLIQFMTKEAKDDIELIQSYDEDEIGSQMTTNYIEIDRSLTIRQAMKLLIEQAEDNDNISTIYVKDEKEKFYGAIDLKDLICARDYVELESLISTSFPFVRAHEKINDCIERLKDYAEDSIPVLDDTDTLIGVITSQNIVEVVDDEMGDDYAKLAGLTAEEDLNETLLQSMKKRLPWLFALLILGMVVSSVVGMFEKVVSQIALIVCFQSLILDMAGNVGTQSLAVTIRVLMDEQLTAKDKMKLVWKEIRIGFSNGLLLGVLSFLFIGLYIMILKGKSAVYAFSISACVAVALIVAMTISSFVGTTIPMFFHKIKVDPAVASGPLITTVNDLVAVVTYYGVAWILLIQVLNLVG
ncbi:magnesium transporter [Anaerosporobacter faecicola]|uniref:magnesium transporter n=1 Tax=Anaerosporobacter faecicola TaxID=2718714 RepID=UPI00143AC9D4|nr:magnesium transporter [Anaerosporobacter faecicola]